MCNSGHLPCVVGMRSKPCYESFCTVHLGLQLDQAVYRKILSEFW